MGRVEEMMVGYSNGWKVGCVEGGLLGFSFETAWHWSNLLDFFLVGNWMCAQVSTWIFPETNLIWTQAKQYGVIFGWEMSNGPILVICKGP